MSIFLHGPKFERAFFGLNKLLEKRSQLAFKPNINLGIKLCYALGCITPVLNKDPVITASRDVM